MAPPKLHGRVRIGLPELHRRIRIGLPELHRRFRIGPPKWFIRFRIVPPQVSNSIWSHYISTVGDFFGTMAILEEKQQKIVIEIECVFLKSNILKKIYHNYKVKSLFFNQIIS